jgi:hypothetical protein
MTGGRAYLYDPSGRHTAALDERSVAAVRLGTALAERTDGQARVVELLRLLEAQRSAGSALAERLLLEPDLAARFWLVEPIAPTVAAAADVARAATPTAASPSQPDRNPVVPVSPPTGTQGAPSLDRTWGPITPG